jgi:hypothetical protein
MIKLETTIKYQSIRCPHIVELIWKSQRVMSTSLKRVVQKIKNLVFIKEEMAAT